jgi:hypothetical protein
MKELPVRIEWERLGRQQMRFRLTERFVRLVYHSIHLELARCPIYNYALEVHKNMHLWVPAEEATSPTVIPSLCAGVMVFSFCVKK